MRILLTGAAGYVGSLLLEKFLKDGRISQVIAVDCKEPNVELRKNQKIIWLHQNLLSDSLFKNLNDLLPIDAVIHTAFRIRAGYGRLHQQYKEENIRGSVNVFNFCFQNNIPKLIYFSSAAAYGAFLENNPNQFLKENSPLKEKEFPYGAWKQEVEEELDKLFYEKKPRTQIVIVRPNSITGPTAQGQHERFGLIRVLKKMSPFVLKLNDVGGRQFIHENDLVNAIGFLLENNAPEQFSIFNLAPNDCLSFTQIAHVLNKKTIKIPVFAMKAGFWLAWHLSRGKIPTTPIGSVRYYLYPIYLDGTKITKLGFLYRYSSKDALLAKE